MLRFLHWKSLFRRRACEGDMEDEFAFHRQARAKDLERRGLSMTEAARKAAQEFGAAPRYEEECRAAHRLQWLDATKRDLRYAWRGIRRNPGFATAAVLSLALGIGMNTVVFSVFESLVLRPLPIHDPNQVLSVETQNGGTVSFPTYRYLRDRNATLEGLAGIRMSPINLESSEGAQRIWGYLATGNYFDVLGVKPLLGRVFHSQDDTSPGASPFAVLSYQAWQSRFGADPDIVGRSIRMNGLSYQVLGVAPRDFHGTELFYWPEVWVPMMMQPQIEAGNPWLENRFTWDTLMVGRLKPQVAPAQAITDLNRLTAQLARQYPESDRGLAMKLAPVGLFGSNLHRPVKLFLAGLLTLVGLVLLTACLNLAGLMSARASDRQREMAIRSSIGASGGQIVRQVLTESVLLSMLGGAGAWGLALVACRLLSHWKAPIDFPLQFDVTPDWRVFLFAGGLAVLTGILFGLAPAVHLANVNLNGLIKGTGGRSGAKTRFGVALRDALVVTEIALCLVLVFCSLLSIKSLKNALYLPLGFNPEHVTTLAFDAAPPLYDRSRAINLQRHVLEQVKTLPGVTAAAYSNSLPLSMDQSSTGVHADGETLKTGQQAPRANYYDVSPGFFAAMQIPLLNGRDFDSRDNEKSPLVAVVNEAFARQIMHTSDPVGKVYLSGPGHGVRVQVVGEIPTGKYVSLTEAPRPAVFRPIHQDFNSTTTLVIRSARPSGQIIREVQKLLGESDSRLPVYGAGSLSSMLGFALLPMHAAAIALTAFGLLAITLAATGIHGLVSYAVSRRRQEIGIRMALGATASSVTRTLLSRLLVLVAIGLALGAVLALLSGSGLSAIIYVAAPLDVASLFSVVLFLLLVSVGSCWTPVSRLQRIDPLNAIRYE